MLNVQELSETQLAELHPAGLLDARSHSATVLVTHPGSGEWTIINVLAPAGHAFFGFRLYATISSVVSSAVRGATQHSELRVGFDRWLRSVGLHKQSPNTTFFVGSLPRAYGSAYLSKKVPREFRLLDYRHFALTVPRAWESKLLEYFRHTVDALGDMAFVEIDDREVIYNTAELQADVDYQVLGHIGLRPGVATDRLTQLSKMHDRLRVLDQEAGALAQYAREIDPRIKCISPVSLWTQLPEFQAKEFCASVVELRMRLFRRLCWPSFHDGLMSYATSPDEGIARDATALGDEIRRSYPAVLAPQLCLAEAVPRSF